MHNSAKLIGRYLFSTMIMFSKSSFASEAVVVTKITRYFFYFFPDSCIFFIVLGIT